MQTFCILLPLCFLPISCEPFSNFHPLHGDSKNCIDSPRWPTLLLFYTSLETLLLKLVIVLNFSFQGDEFIPRNTHFNVFGYKSEQFASIWFDFGCDQYHICSHVCFHVIIGFRIFIELH